MFAHFRVEWVLWASIKLNILDDNASSIAGDEAWLQVSERIKQEYENGKEYYQFQGKDLSILPTKEMNRPNQNFIEWHNSKIFKGWCVERNENGQTLQKRQTDHRLRRHFLAECILNNIVYFHEYSAKKNALILSLKILYGEWY